MLFKSKCARDALHPADGGILTALCLYGASGYPLGMAHRAGRHEEKLFHNFW